MDRFIGLSNSDLLIPDGYLKSNMDRFIASSRALARQICPDLKSNMDRFIVLEVNKVVGTNRI